MKWRYFKQSIFFGVVRLSALIITLALLGILTYIFFQRLPGHQLGFSDPAAHGFHDEGRDHAGHRRHLLSDRRGDCRSPAPGGRFGDLSDGICKTGTLYPHHPHRRQLPGRRAFRGFRALRPGFLCRLSEIRLQHPFRVPDAGHPDSADDHRRFGRGAEGGAPDIPGGLSGPGCFQMEHHLPDRPAVGACRAS